MDVDNLPLENYSLDWAEFSREESETACWDLAILKMYGLGNLLMMTSAYHSPSFYFNFMTLPLPL
jgi:hypothetical protein